MTMIRVLVVEDSLVQRAHLVRTLEADGDIKVIGEAAGAVEAMDLARELLPDVITLDLQIPGGGGQHAIEQIMANSPTPILVLSATIAGRDSAAAVEALIAGAVDILPKPGTWSASTEQTVRERVRILRGVTVLRHHRGSQATRRASTGPTSSSPTPIVAIAASTGGPAALAIVLAGLAGLRAAVLVVQHLHPDFLDGLVTWMERVSPLPVQVATNGARLTKGVVLIGPGEVHLKVGPDDTVVLDPDPVTLHRPSADALFASLEGRARSTVAVVLTGMGNDGTKGLLALRRAGATTIGQDEATSAVFGMPRAAQQAGAAMKMLPVEQIADAVMAWARR